MFDHFLLNGVLLSVSANELYTCYGCETDYHTREQFEMHNWTFHPRLKPYICCFCKKHFQVFVALKIHMKFTPNPIASRVFLNAINVRASSKHANSLRLHAGQHVDLDRDGIDCPTCWKRFGSSAMLTRHLEGDCECRYVCSECHERFKSIKRLKLHMCSHNIGLESFVCSDCDIEFTTWETITHHIVMTHEPWRAWYCTDCKEKFVDKYRFQRHKCKAEIETCDDQPPKKKQVMSRLQFCCEVCGRFYSSKILFTLHLENHSNHSERLPLLEMQSRLFEPEKFVASLENLSSKCFEVYLWNMLSRIQMQKWFVQPCSCSF